MSQKAAVVWILAGVALALGGLWGIVKAPALWCASQSHLAPRELQRLVILGKAEMFCTGETGYYIRYVARVECLDEACGGLWLPGDEVLRSTYEVDANGSEEERRVVEAHNACSATAGNKRRYVEGPDGWYVMAQRCGGDLFLRYNWQRPRSEMPWMQNVPP